MFFERIKIGQKVLTRNGPGEIISFDKNRIQVELDKAIPGKKIFFFKEGEITIDSDFTLVRVINLGTYSHRLIANAQNYPSWEECLEALKQPFPQNETLIALNFKERKFESNRLLRGATYNLIEVYLDMYWPMDAKFYEFESEAKEAWKKIDDLDGTIDHILLCTLINLETFQILTRAIFSTMEVIKKEVY